MKKKHTHGKLFAPHTIYAIEVMCPEKGQILIKYLRHRKIDTVFVNEIENVFWFEFWNQAFSSCSLIGWTIP